MGLAMVVARRKRIGRQVMHCAKVQELYSSGPRNYSRFTYNLVDRPQWARRYRKRTSISSSKKSAPENGVIISTESSRVLVITKLLLCSLRKISNNTNIKTELRDDAIMRVRESQVNSIEKAIIKWRYLDWESP